MATKRTFPHTEINIRDDEKVAIAPAAPLPLHIPIFFIYAAQGPIGIPVLGTYAQHAVTFGDYTFDERGPFHQHPTLFAKRAANYQQIYLVRLADHTASTASVALFCTVAPAQVIQYERDVYGKYVVDSAGKPIPETMSDGTTVKTEAGYTLNWTVRQLASNESYDQLTEVTANIGGVQTTTFPVMALEAAGPGSAANMTGFRLYYSTRYDPSTVNNSNSMTYRFEPVYRSRVTSNVLPIIDIYNDTYIDFSFKPNAYNAYNADTAQYLTFNDLIQNQYIDSDQNNLLPYNFKIYEKYVGDIANIILESSPELVGTDPYLINLITAIDQDGAPYYHFTVSANSATVLNPNVTQFLNGGSDGILTKANLETLTIDYIAGDTYPEINNPFRYPFSHIYDSGYALQTKLALLKIWDQRDDVKIEFSTQDIANQANTAAEDQSTGSALRAAIMLYPESILFGTQAMRAAIYQQCSTLTDTQTYTNIVPMVLDRLIKRCIYDGTDHLKGSPKGRPNSEVTILSEKNINWTPANDGVRQKNWDTGLNYADYCDRSTLFFPDLRSIHPVETSLLSDDTFVDRLVYLKYIARRQWTIFSGMTERAQILFPRIAESISKACSYAFNGDIDVSVKVYQTDIDAALGYETTVEISVQGSMPNRVWKVIVPVSRRASK